MKRLQQKLTVLLLFSLLISFGQEPEDKTSRFNIAIQTGIGFGKVENDNQANYNLNANVGEIQLNYNISNNYGIATGLGYSQLSGNAFNSNGNFYHERDALKIPLLLTSNYEILDKIKFPLSIGFYAQTILKDEYTYQTTKLEDVYSGWNFGFQASIGIAFELKSNIDLGLNISTQSDFTKFNTEQSAPFNDEQLISSLNTIGLFINWHL